ncbi:lytic transglycosylase domain-containing protein [Candidatus Magnetominusculus xianensis]|uniref:Lytic transglycosylase n=1 Tax=Candidatus Magnetominusculus xianensis TaxID=1748249 RepID=A0ABR5SEL1_9BACT|nr:lytic transglycosylase domain-containing protein [Candidatus Magnetominusculus xianensis]KWT82974.1 lytic transglycosylase [Candidatus Magnetominusculus xianensis]MBF0403053.1 transglycosylase SLT domain-containing protein [Nitrospirota bacterium]
MTITAAYRAAFLFLLLLLLPAKTDALINAVDDTEGKSETPGTMQDNLMHRSVSDLSTKGVTYSESVRERSYIMAPLHPPPEQEDNDGSIKKEEMLSHKGFKRLTQYDNDTNAAEAISAQLTFFADTIKKKFNQWLVKGSKYLPLMKKILNQHNLPEELVYLPLIESGYNNFAKSPAQAAGPWQFIAATARDYNLKVDFWVDERQDPIKSTYAASKYLRFLFEKFGTWDLALAAYNAGEIKIEKALKMANTDSYWTLITTGLIARETKLFVPKFIAAKEIAIDPERYGFSDIEYDTPLEYDIVIVKPPATISFIAKAASTSTMKIRELNPELKQWCIPPDVPKYRLRVPHGMKDEFRLIYENTPEHQRYQLDMYRVRKADSIKKISKRLNVPQDILAQINGKSVSTKLKEGTYMYLPPSDIKHSKSELKDVKHKDVKHKDLKRHDSKRNAVKPKHKVVKHNASKHKGAKT